MLIKLRDKNNELVYKDLGDVNLDISIEKDKVKINSEYYLDEEFSDEEKAKIKAEEIIAKKKEIEEIVKK